MLPQVCNAANKHMLGVVDLAGAACAGLRMLPRDCRTCGMSLSMQSTNSL